MNKIVKKFNKKLIRKLILFILINFKKLLMSLIEVILLYFVDQKPNFKNKLYKEWRKIYKIIIHKMLIYEIDQIF
jgi:hypothetical protein